MAAPLPGTGSAARRLLLVGGGHAHLQVLQAMAQQRFVGAQTMLVSESAETVYSGMVPGHVAGHYPAETCRIALPPLCEAAGAYWLEASVVGLDAAARRVELADGRMLEYDVLSLDTGSTMDRDQIPGARERGLFTRPMDRFLEFWSHVPGFAAGRGMACVVVIGGGAAGVELALAMRHRAGRGWPCLPGGGRRPAAAGPRRRGAPPRAARALERAAAWSALHERCVAIEDRSVRLASGLRVACDVPVIATGGRPAPWLAASGLAVDAQGAVRTGPTLQSVSHPEVFAAGDASVRDDAPRPKSGVYAVRAGPPLAINLRRQLAHGELESYRPQRVALNLLSCGDERAIASWGPWAAEGAWVWRWKDRIDRRWVEAFAPEGLARAKAAA